MVSAAPDAAAPVPVIDVGALTGAGGDPREAARAIGHACRTHGFFQIVNHGVDAALERRLFACAREFFAWPDARKAEIAMARGGRAWRGWFPLGAELTSGRPDWKQGVYFGAELDASHPRVRAGTPLHGANLFPAIPGFRDTVRAWIDAMTALGHALLRGIALSLALPADWFARYTADPTVLFRIFEYPEIPRDAAEPAWSVGEHTDYGVLTILLQDDAGGLEVKAGGRWTPAPPIPGAFVCNIGDMLDRMTGGLYRSTPHRVRNTASRSRLSFPFFFDPSWDAVVQPIPGCAPAHDDAGQRWDRASVHAWTGTYGEYLLAKVSKVFPELGREVL
ncbi:MAG: isopenicillin N synthase family oxygenase [Proteobacteria bacterium]|nr:MAG: isopenicillin N synthase family oxygenase [Pseudomonadota bacterium]